jgi:hypothetical protein
MAARSSGIVSDCAELWVRIPQWYI